VIEHNPRYDRTYVFKLRLVKMQPGDIILTRNREATGFKARKKSDIIAAASGGNFSHAILFTTSPVGIEAISGGGVSTLSLQNTFFHALANIRVLRYNDASIAREAASYAMMLLGQGYSVRNAARSIAPGTPQPNRISTGTFCSALVATAFRVAGAPEFVAVEPLKTTPGHLQHMRHLSDVTEEVAEPILAPANIELMSALDGERNQSPMSAQASLYGAYYKSISPRIAALTQNHSLAVEPPKTFFECLEFIVGALAAARRHGMDIGSDVYRELERIDAQIHSLLSEGKLEKMYADAIVNDNRSHLKLIEQSFESKPDISYEDLKGMLRSTDQQITSRSSILNDPERPVGLSKAWDKWCEMTKEVLKPFVLRKQILEEVMARVFPEGGIE
jgi:hypothetical protein